MMRFLDWLKSKLWPEDALSDPPRRDSDRDPRRLPFGARPSGGHTIARTRSTRPAMPKRQPEVVNLDPQHARGKVENRGPGKNVLVRNKYRREDSGTHDTLTLLDDSVVETKEEPGFDPYNTGQVDRSRNWDKHTK
jgi:hypothetical protein